MMLKVYGIHNTYPCFLRKMHFTDLGVYIYARNHLMSLDTSDPEFDTMLMRPLLPFLYIDTMI